MLTGQNGILNRASEAKEKTETANIDEQRKLAQAEALMNTEKTTYKGVTLPEGFAPTKIDGEDSIDDGLVITDGYGNEYVWVEVPKTTEVYPTAGLSITNFTDDEYKKIEDDLHTYTRVYRNGTSYRDIWYDAKDDQKEANKSDWYQSESEYNTTKQKMLKSVYQNGGFWVGRYEAGIETNRTSSGTATTTPLSKRNLYPYNNVTRTQAKKLAEQVKAGSYTSSLMFGVQWDLVMKFIEEKTVAKAKVENAEEVRTKIARELNDDSTNIGNYNNNLWTITNEKAKYSIDYGMSFQIFKKTYSKKLNSAVLLTTGADRTFSLMNIYDIAGNVKIWTLEKTSIDDNYLCTPRGGGYCNNGYDLSASSRGGADTSYSDSHIGFRVSIY